MPLSYPKRFHKTLGFRLSAWYSGIFILSSLVFSLVSYLFVFSTVRDNREAIRNQLAQSKSLAEAKGIAAVEGSVSAQRDPSRRTTFFIRITDAENRTRFVSHPRLWEKFAFADPQQPPLDGEWQYYTSKRDGDLLEVASARLGNGNLLQVGKSIQDREEVLERFGETLLATIIPMVLIGVAGGGFLAFRALRPIRNLSVVARSIVDTGRFNARVPDNRSGDEVNDLVVLFNQMLAKIETLIESMRDALDNVAHDLRTPITRVRVMAEEALGASADDGTRREALADCLEETERLTILLDTLMDISEAETGAMKLSIENVDLSALINEVVDLYTYVAEEKGVGLFVRAVAPLCLPADRSRLRQVIANLVDNAIKYTPRDGRVEIETQEKNRQAVVLVRDTGVGIPADEITRIWDRLYRGDKSRSQRGLGLGLSLVRAVAKAHAGSVDVTSDPRSGSIFSLHLPLNSKARI